MILCSSSEFLIEETQDMPVLHQSRELFMFKMRVNYLSSCSEYLSLFFPDSTESWRREPLLTGRSQLFGTGSGNRLSDLTRCYKAICRSSGHNKGEVIWLNVFIHKRRWNWTANKASSRLSIKITWNGTQSHITEAVQTPVDLRSLKMNPPSNLKTLRRL